MIPLLKIPEKDWADAELRRLTYKTSKAMSADITSYPSQDHRLKNVDLLFERNDKHGGNSSRKSGDHAGDKNICGILRSKT